jgi:hypothetical protein
LWCTCMCCCCCCMVADRDAHRHTVQWNVCGAVQVHHSSHKSWEQAAGGVRCQPQHLTFHCLSSWVILLFPRVGALATPQAPCSRCKPAARMVQRMPKAVRRHQPLQHQGHLRSRGGGVPGVSPAIAKRGLVHTLSIDLCQWSRTTAQPRPGNMIRAAMPLRRSSTRLQGRRYLERVCGAAVCAVHMQHGA